MGKDLWKLEGIRRVMIATAILTLMQSIIIIMQSVWLAQAVSGLFHGDALERQLGHIGGFVSALIARQLLSMLLQKIAYHFAETTGQQLRRALMDKLFVLGPRYVMGQGTGNMVTLVREGIAKYRTYLELIIPRMVSNGLTPLLIGIWVLRLDWLSALILGLVFPILIAFMILLGLAAQKQMDRQWVTYRVLSNHFVDSLRGLETLRFLGRSRAHGATIGRTSEQYRKATLSSMKVAFLSSFALDFFTMLTVAVVAVSLGLRLVDGGMLLEPALTILILAPEFFVPIRSLGADYHATMDGKEAGEEIRRILQQPVPGGEMEEQQDTSIRSQNDDTEQNNDLLQSNDVGQNDNVVHNNVLDQNNDAEQNNNPDRNNGADQRNRLNQNHLQAQPYAASWKNSTGRNLSQQNVVWNYNSVLSLEDLSVVYSQASIQKEATSFSVQKQSLPNQQQASPTQNQSSPPQDYFTALHNISFSWKGNGKIGIIGASGAGKSTLIDVLAGFLIPNEGTAQMHNQGTSTLHDPLWRNQTAYIPQHPYLFSASLLENIALYEPQATEQQVMEAAIAAGLSGVLHQLSNGLHEKIGEGGRSLSGGQEQRVALARALLGQRRVLLLDEPTAHLDIETEYELKQMMLPLFQDRLVFLATHRLHWMVEMDHIIVMDKGRIAEQGSYRELLRRGGMYAQLIREQWEGTA